MAIIVLFGEGSGESATEGAVALSLALSGSGEGETTPEASAGLVRQLVGIVDADAFVLGELDDSEPPVAGDAIATRLIGSPTLSSELTL